MTVAEQLRLDDVLAFNRLFFIRFRRIGRCGEAYASPSFLSLAAKLSEFLTGQFLEMCPGSSQS